MFIKIEANSDSSHAFQNGGTLEPGWAFWNTDSVPVPASFPWVDIVVEDVTHSAITDGDKVLVAEYTRPEVISAVEREITELEPEPEPAPVDSVKAEKITEIKKDCEEYIYAGADVTYADGIKEHFTYTLADQSNISEMFTAIMAGATEYPYHADGEICKIYSKAEIVTIYGTLSLFKTEATTYHNSLKAQVNAMTDIDAISATKFKETELTGEYLTNYNEMMASAQTQLNAILAKIPADEAV